MYSWHPDKPGPRPSASACTPPARKVWGITRRWDGGQAPDFRRIGDYPDAGAGRGARPRPRDPGRSRRRGAPASGRPTHPPPDTFGVLAEQFLGTAGPSGAASCGPDHRGVPPGADGSTPPGCTTARCATSGAPTSRPDRHRRDRARDHYRHALPGGARAVLVVDAATVEVDCERGGRHRGLRHARAGRVMTDGELAAIWAATVTAPTSG